MAQIEKRTKLTDKQFTILTEAGTASQKALKAFEDAQRYTGAVSALILDAHGLDEGLQARIDEGTKELVYMIEAPAVTAEAPASSKTDNGSDE